MFQSVSQNITSWWGGGTPKNTDEQKDEDVKEEKSVETEIKSGDDEGVANASEVKQHDTDESPQVAQPQVRADSENVEDDNPEPSQDQGDVQTKALNAAKEWGSYLFNVGKAASKTVTEKAKVLKHKVEESHILDKTILGDFTKEQEKFVNEKQEKKKHSEAAVPPWVGYNEEEAMKTQILALSSDKRNFLRSPPSGVQFQFDFESIQPVAIATLQEDPHLQEMRFELVPKQVKEEHFWRNYFYRVSLIKQSTQLTSLAQRTGTTGETSSNGNSEGKDKKGSTTEIKITQPTPELELPPESPPADHEFISDAYQDQLNEEELKNEMQQLGMNENKEKTEDEEKKDDDNIPEWEKELQAELNEYEVVVGDGDFDDADLENEILQEIEESKGQL